MPSARSKEPRTGAQEILQLADSEQVLWKMGKTKVRNYSQCRESRLPSSKANLNYEFFWYTFKSLFAGIRKLLLVLINSAEICIP